MLGFMMPSGSSAKWPSLHRCVISRDPRLQRSCLLSGLAELSVFLDRDLVGASEGGMAAEHALCHTFSTFWPVMAI